jgi:hypothetical protein
MEQEQQNVPIGFATKFGVLVSLGQYAVAIVLLLVGTKQQQVEYLPALIGAGTLSTLGVLGGRYVQANTTTIKHVEEPSLPTTPAELAEPPPTVPASVGESAPAE